MEPKILPVFPLNLVAFPGEKLNLHIFEPRYRQLFRECEKENKSFVVCPHYKGSNVPIGTEMILLGIEKKYPNGKMDVRTQGIKLVKIVAFYKNIIDKLYGGVEVKYLPWDDKSDFQLNQILLEKLIQLYKIVDINEVPLGDSLSFRTFQVAHKVGFSFEQELEFLEIGSEKDRQSYMINHLEKFIPIVYEAEEMKRRARLNGHFKEAIPPH
jgi:hypothetical protein